MTEDALRRLFPHASEQFIAANLSSQPMFPSAPTMMRDAPENAHKRIRQSGKPKLNKLETAFLEYLQAHYDPKDIRAQAVTIVIGNGVRYTPDFTNLRAGLVWETKGPFARDDSIVKLKVAASLYDIWKFHLVTRPQPGDPWNIQPVFA